MKALKSPRAQAVLADPAAKHQLRAFLASRSQAAASAPAASAVSRAAPSTAPDGVIEVKSHGKTVRVGLRVVAKAP